MAGIEHFIDDLMTTTEPTPEKQPQEKQYLVFEKSWSAIDYVFLALALSPIMVIALVFLT